jgi:hypothetical protein
MKADRLNRKTHLKKISTNPFSEKVFYDLTEVGPEEGAEGLFLLEDLFSYREKNVENIEKMPAEFESAEDILLWSASLIAESPLAQSLWKDAAKKGWSVGISDLNSDGFYLDVIQKQIWLDSYLLPPSSLGRSPYFRAALLTTLVRALRDVWHEQREEAFETLYSPEDVLMLERVRAADCDTVTILSAWELRSAGFGEIWRHLLGCEEGDMAIIFTRVLERDPSAHFDGAALAYTFRQWFANDQRVDGCDHETLESLDDLMLSDLQENGTVYLENMGSTIINDPLFAGLNDEINQTHLFHLMYDLEVVMVENVPFRDQRLARKIFPGSETISTIL